MRARPDTPQPSRRRFLQAGLVGAAVVGGFGVAPARAETALPEPLVINDIAIHRDVAYADPVGRAHLLDVYLPVNAGGPVPVVVFQMGSAFRTDDTKGDALSVGVTEPPPTMIGAPQLAALWVPRGYAVVGLNVRSSAQVPFPGQVHDVKAAIRFLREHAPQLGLDADRFATMGNSSGAWVATMAAVTSGLPEFEGNLGNPHQSSAVRAAIDLYGPTDFLRMDAHAVPGGAVHDAADSPESELMGFPIQTDSGAVQIANPANYVRTDSPPVFIVHGTSDPYVPVDQSEILFAAYQRAGGTASLTLVPDTEHTDVYLWDAQRSAGRTVSQTHNGVTTTGTEPPPTFETLLGFLDAHLRN